MPGMYEVGMNNSQRRRQRLQINRYQNIQLTAIESDQPLSLLRQQFSTTTVVVAFPRHHHYHHRGMCFYSVP